MWGLVNPSPCRQALTFSDFFTFFLMGLLSVATTDMKEAKASRGPPGI